MELFGGTFSKLANSLDYATTKNNVLSQNISNVDTPGYRAQKVSFKNALSDALQSGIETKRTSEKHIKFNKDEEQSFRITTTNGTIYNNNGNNVDIDKEMAELAKNQIYYNALVDRINGKLSSLQTVVKGGN